MGDGLRSGAALVAPAMVAHVSDKLRADAAIAKEKRKAAEARTLQRPKPKKGAKGGGGGASAASQE